MTIHPLLKLAVSHPHLLADHAEAYASLVAEEAKEASTTWARRAALYVGAALLAALGVLLIAVALLIAAATPLEQRPANWALFAIPLVPFLIAVPLIFSARSTSLKSAFGMLKAQLRSDKELLKKVSAP